MFFLFVCCMVYKFRIYSVCHFALPRPHAFCMCLNNLGVQPSGTATHMKIEEDIHCFFIPWTILVYIKFATNIVIPGRKHRGRSVSSWVDLAMPLCPSVYTRTSPLVFEISIWTFVYVLFSLISCSLEVLPTHYQTTCHYSCHINWSIRTKSFYGNFFVWQYTFSKFGGDYCPR